MKKPLRDYVAELNRKLGKEMVVLYRNAKRQGLVRSRLKGAELTAGVVLTFLDSHCEVTEGWVEPLLTRIKEDRRNVVCPVIEVAFYLTLVYFILIKRFIEPIASPFDRITMAVPARR